MTLATSKQLGRIWLFFAPLFGVLLTLDQLSKWWAESQLGLYDHKDFGFDLSHNYGIAFGLPLPQWAIFVLSLGVLGLGVYLVVTEQLWRDRWQLTGMALILAGAVGNLIDRMVSGYVIDFIKVYWWPTFNLADVWIVCGVALFAYRLLVSDVVGLASEAGDEL